MQTDRWFWVMSFGRHFSYDMVVVAVFLNASLTRTVRLLQLVEPNANIVDTRNVYRLECAGKVGA